LQVYETLWGESEWNPNGRLRDWDVRPRLSEIELPTLITSGRYDECTPELASAAHRGIPGSEWVLFEESAHMAFVEEPDRYRAVLSDFHARAEAA
jgi:proline-specific peptidase